MDREDIIRMAREAGLAYGSDDKPLGSVTRFAALIAAAEREKVAAWVMSQGYATGHGDTIKDLLKELEWQIKEREREACAKFIEHDYVRQFERPWRDDLSAAIRARGQA